MYIFSWNIYKKLLLWYFHWDFIKLNLFITIFYNKIFNKVVNWDVVNIF